MNTNNGHSTLNLFSMSLLGSSEFSSWLKWFSRSAVATAKLNAYWIRIVFGN